MKYDDEFKRQTVQKVLDGQSVRSVSRELGVTESQIHKWRRAALTNGDGIKSGVELTETAVLSKRIRELEMEVEILKKATLIFGRGS
ncbi:MAG TPA: transposase [Pyrinomonadaceae bacterium]|jgi:transposase|nr:transposase [Pyrinomonadaceae bacterium]